MQWVFDASVTMAWCFEDERTASTEALFDRLTSGIPAAVPHLWPLEIGNVLLMATRRGRITIPMRTAFLDLLAAAPISIDVPTVERVPAATLALAETHRLTMYDASYLELAIRLQVPLATLDTDLRAAAVTAGVVLL